MPKNDIENKTAIPLIDNEKELLKEQLKSQSEQMAKMMEDFKKIQSEIKKNGDFKPSVIDETIDIGCRINNGVHLCSKDESVIIDLLCDEETEVFVSDFKLVLGNPFGYKELFKKDILYFVDEENYQRFRIKRDISLNKEDIIDHLTKDSVNEMIEWLKSITNEKHNFNVLYCLMYQVAKLYPAGNLKDWGYESRTTFEKYFEVEVNNLVNNLVANQ